MGDGVPCYGALEIVGLLLLLLLLLFSRINTANLLINNVCFIYF